VFQYLPILDDRNINDQGIDAAGVTIDNNKYLVELLSDEYSFAVEADATAAAAAINAVKTGTATKSGSATPWTVAVSTQNLGYTTESLADAVKAEVAARVTQGSGNMYGSSKDIGTIVGRLPHITENGGRVNRVSTTRLTLQGDISEFGFFTEFTRDSIEFDSDERLREHLARELVNAATQIQEAQLQIDLLGAANVELFAGNAITDEDITGEGTTPSLVQYDDFTRLDQILTDNRTPRQTTVITGSKFTDTRVVPACRIMFVGSEIVPHLKRMKDPFNNKAFIEVQHYADAGNTLNGEIGSLDQFRVVQVPEMLHWAAAGDDVGTNPGYREEAGKYNVYPMMVIGDESFTALGFQNDGKSLGVKTMTKNYGMETMGTSDPYGKTGISSMSWYYGFLAFRPERIGIIKTVAPL
jgi:N4-gp56 family major capsid protein